MLERKAGDSVQWSTPPQPKVEARTQIPSLPCISHGVTCIRIWFRHPVGIHFVGCDGSTSLQLWEAKLSSHCRLGVAGKFRSFSANDNCLPVLRTALWPDVECMVFYIYIYRR